MAQLGDLGRSRGATEIKQVFAGPSRFRQLVSRLDALRTMVAGLADVAALAAVGDRFGVTANTIRRRLVERRVDIRLGVGGPARRRAAAIATGQRLGSRSES